MLANQHSEGCLILSRMCALHTQMSLALNFLTVWGKNLYSTAAKFMLAVKTVETNKSSASNIVYLCPLQ